MLIEGLLRTKKKHMISFFVSTVLLSLIIFGILLYGFWNRKILSFVFFVLIFGLYLVFMPFIFILFFLFL